jgi:uncharacterized protein YbaP (TraB family)
VITTKPTGFSRYFSKAELQALGKSGLRKSPDVFERIQPWFLYFLSTFQNCEGTPSNRAIMDAKIEQIAQNARIPSLGLEAPATAFAKLQGFSDKDYALMIRAELQARQFINPSDYSKTATEMYIRGEVQKIQVWQFHYYAGGNPRGLSMIKKLWNDRMLRDRNRAWMPTILREFAKGDAFVAVGAMHLGGPHGLMPMLSRKGYVVTPIRFVFR